MAARGLHILTGAAPLYLCWAACLSTSIVLNSVATQPSGGSQGVATDIKIQAEQIVKTKARINKIIADETGRSIEQVEQDTDRDYWMSVEEAIEYGIVSKVVSSVSELG